MIKIINEISVPILALPRVAKTLHRIIFRHKLVCTNSLASYVSEIRRFCSFNWIVFVSCWNLSYGGSSYIYGFPAYIAQFTVIAAGRLCWLSPALWLFMG